MAGNGVIGQGSATTLYGYSNVYYNIQRQGYIEGAIVMAGTNDYNFNVTADNFRTSVNDALTLLKTRTNKILVITPLHRANESANSVGMTLSDYSNIIKEICRSKSITYYDGFSISINPNDTSLMPDGLHPNNAGHEIIYANIRNIVSNTFSF